MPTDSIAQVMIAYPQIYHACHLQHTRARSHAARISTRESWILGHLDETHPASPARLARHLSLSPSTVSEALNRLEKLGYVIRLRSDGDRRRIQVFLSARGAAAMKAASVLDAGRVERLLAQLPPAERTRAVNGLTLLAGAARQLNAKEPRRWDQGEK